MQSETAIAQVSGVHGRWWWSPAESIELKARGCRKGNPARRRNRQASERIGIVASTSLLCHLPLRSHCFLDIRFNLRTANKAKHPFNHFAVAINVESGRQIRKPAVLIADSLFTNRDWIVH